MTDRYRDLWREVSRGEKILAAGLALLVSGFSLAGAGLVLEVADGFRAGPHLLLTGSSLVLTGGITIAVAGAVNEHDERRLRRERLEREGESWPAERRRTWTQVSALEFVMYGDAIGGGRWELERVIFEDTPAGRLAAKRFQMEENVTGPTVLHTRDKGRR